MELGLQMGKRRKVGKAGLIMLENFTSPVNCQSDLTFRVSILKILPKLGSHCFHCSGGYFLFLLKMPSCVTYGMLLARLMLARYFQVAHSVAIYHGCLAIQLWIGAIHV